MSKYVIDTTLDNVKKVIAMGVTKGGAIWTDTTDIENLEELNSDYINEHFGNLQDGAYQRGLEEGNDIGYKDGDKDGRNEAWEAARKIIRMSDGEILDLFPDCYASVCTAAQVILKYDVSEAIAKLKAYEEKQKTDEIKVGDEVKHKEYKNRFIVTKMQNGYIYGISKDGSWNNFRNDGSFVKTGSHFDIDKILEAMRT